MTVDEPLPPEPPVVLSLTPSQHLALWDLLLDIVLGKMPMALYIDVVNGQITTPAMLLEVVAAVGMTSLQEQALADGRDERV